MQAFATEPGGPTRGDLTPLPGDPGGRDLAVLPNVLDYNDWIPNFSRFVEWWNIFLSQWAFAFTERDENEYEALGAWAEEVLASLRDARAAIGQEDRRAHPPATVQNQLFEEVLRDIANLQIDSVQALVQGETDGSVINDECEAADQDGDGVEEETIFRFDESLRRRRMRAS